ncbi:MAG: lipopolysaccharide biosynthesis protein [Chitinophagaceae bacterium]|nr:MAG: lipopolysaccharide biosynthesis protein [Chitinophagaceae bacterium]
MDKRNLRWNFIFQYGWVLTNIFNSILLLPLYLKNIDSSTLGIWLATGSILTWMTLADPGIGEVLQQKIAEGRGKGDNRETGRLIGSGFIASGVILLISIVVGLVCYSFIGRLIKTDVSQYQHLPAALIVSVLATGLSLVSFTLSGINQGLQNSVPVAISSLTANFLFLFVNLFFLFTGYGVLSIAIANLCRAVYLNVYNLAAMKRLLHRESTIVEYDRVHFKKFLRIFSFTSASKIITGISGTIDLLVLARFVSPGMITLFEINKRPVNITYSLVGRHSVALMPLLSHAKGMGQTDYIREFIRKQFRFYCYAAFLFVFIFLFNYENLLLAWTGPGHFAGNLVLALLVGNFLTGLMGYFMSNIGYALGDIRRNSIYNVVRGIVYGTAVWFAAKHYGITGVLVASICITLLSDLLFFSYRVYRMGYIGRSLFTGLIRPLMLILPVVAMGAYGLQLLTASSFPEEGSVFTKLFINAGMLTMLYAAMVLVADHDLRFIAKRFTGKYLITPINRFRGT